MRFMLMCCFDEDRWTGLADSQRTEIMDAYGRWIQDHVASGHHITGGKLDDSATATTVRKPGGQPSLKDGPFSEAKEQIGGYHVIECADHETAVAIAQGIPTLPAGGVVEVRPLLRWFD